ncbi:efflux RND transporter periplasmic adaptor subunit [Chryseobacterium sp.]|uniref:efflux RND transporter periplasmic adaptor subunit n=1 Tax=Chryseobacterium sp. TaxID=1871047 RepID=UPI00388D5E12
MYSKKILAASALALVMLSCSKNKKVNKEENSEVPILRIVEKDTIVSNSFVTDIQAKKNIEIRCRMMGLLQHIYVNEGQSVRKGQILFKINDSEYQMELAKINANVRQAEADIRIASIEVSQLQSLYNKKYVASNELDLAKAKLESAKAKKAYTVAEKDAILQKISFTKITAPFDGVIDVIPFKEGSLIEDGALLTTLSQLDEVFAYFSIPEKLYFELTSEDKLHKHQKIELTLPNGKNYEFGGTLKTAESEIDRNTGSIRYKVAFPNPDRLIKHGTSGKLVISEHQPKSILIPQKSTFSIQDKTYVFVVDKNNKVKQKNIVVASPLNDSYLIESGLNRNDIIVLEGTQSLRDGDMIKVKAKM